ncbi:hypothetical protein GIB67_016856 [Kingdonia uniflora]|uniref:PPM-type phosphatase domain-containing protein n=1 Tax=Kingdonia uniflora TaxID=39325 RepID=A0A7J7LQG4_9MAGN|nr:hypothetical protein GIB67_016856 [Kingdonia uniflora]
MASALTTISSVGSVAPPNSIIIDKKIGVNKLTDLVGVILGPKGRIVVELEDPVENIGAKLVRQAAANTNDLVGDGTTTSIILDQGLIAEDVKARGLGREDWLPALPRELVAGFVKTDKEFQSRGETSGTTVTFIIIDGWTVTVVSVGDSRCILDSRGGGLSILIADHRLEETVEECIGPLRCWPGVLCLSRPIGDMDIGEFIVHVPYVKQVKEALRSRGLKDDTTCIAVDIISPDNSLPPSPPPKKQRKLRSLIFRKRSHDSVSKLSKKLSAVSIVEELFEEGLAMLVDRLQMSDLAAVSAGNNDEVGQMIAEAMSKVGRKGVVTLEEGKSSENSLFVVEGMQFDRGNISPYFVTDSEKMTVEFENYKVCMY